MQHMIMLMSTRIYATQCDVSGGTKGISALAKLKMLTVCFRGLSIYFICIDVCRVEKMLWYRNQKKYLCIYQQLCKLIDRQFVDNFRQSTYILMFYKDYVTLLALLFVPLLWIASIIDCTTIDNWNNRQYCYQ